VSKIYFISDLHFHHTNILRYEPRRIKLTCEYVVNNNLIMFDCSPKEMINNLIKKYTQALIDNNKELIEECLTYHDEMILDSINKKVKEEDTLYFLGDFGYCQYGCGTKFHKVKEEIKNKIIELGNKIKCKNKIMICGNHDWRYTSSDGTHFLNDEVKDFWHKVGFKDVYANPILLKEWFLLSHEPVTYMNPNAIFFNICGHVHSNPMYITESEHHLIVCGDRFDFKPQQIDKFNINPYS